MAVFKVPPFPKPRMTQRDRWKQRPVVVRYHQWKDDLKKEAKRLAYTLPEAYSVIFYVPMPKSWSKKKKMEYLGTPHKQRPDLDNYLKALNDCLLPDEDSKVWHIVASKYWTSPGDGIIILGKP